jgi:hypothetical protein
VDPCTGLDRHCRPCSYRSQYADQHAFIPLSSAVVRCLCKRMANSDSPSQLLILVGDKNATCTRKSNSYAMALLCPILSPIKTLTCQCCTETSCRHLLTGQSFPKLHAAPFLASWTIIGCMPEQGRRVNHTPNDVHPESCRRVTRCDQCGPCTACSSDPRYGT